MNAEFEALLDNSNFSPLRFSYHVYGQGACFLRTGQQNFWVQVKNMFLKDFTYKETFR